MKSLRFSASSSALTCSADTVVPRITNRSTPAFVTIGASSVTRLGDSAPATATPAARISAIRSAMRSGWTGSE